MNKFLILISFCISSFAVADGHSNLGLEKRQPDAAMNVTSVTLGQDLSTISAEGDMEGLAEFTQLKLLIWVDNYVSSL